MTKTVYPLLCMTLIGFGTINTAQANNFFAQATHSDKVLPIHETSTYLDYLEWTSMEELYKHAITAAAAPLVANKPGTAPPKLLDVPVSLFTFPKIPEARFWFWMSKADTIKKAKIQHLVEGVKALATPISAEKLFEMIVQQSLREQHAETLKKVRELLKTSKDTAVPFVQNLSKQLDSAEFNVLIEKMKSSSSSLEVYEKNVFWENISKMSDSFKQLDLLERASPSLLTDTECSVLLERLIEKQPLSELVITKILQNPMLLRILPDSMLKKLLSENEKFMREKFWLQQMSMLSTKTDYAVDADVLNTKEIEFVKNLKRNQECIFFIKERLNQLTDGNFMHIVSNTENEKLNVQGATTSKPLTVEKK